MNTELYSGFDAVIDRRNTESLKWDAHKSSENQDILPMWVADMDFVTPSGVIEGLKKRVEHGIFGYSTDPEPDRQALTDWLETRHGLTITPECVLFSPGVVDSIYHTLKALYNKGAKIVIQTPVYGPFRSMPERADMQVIENPLIHTDGEWKMDLDGLEAIFKSGADAFILCSPHNPVGRIWRRDELQALVSLCNKYNVSIISDEIHADFELRGHKHIPILSIDGAENAVMLVSATKTFNLAALRHSAIVVKNSETRKRISDMLGEAMTDVNLFGKLATRFAYQTGGEWLDALNEYLTDGRDILLDGFARIDGIDATSPEGTYLMWLDMRALNMSEDELVNFFTEKCGVILSGGSFFGQCGTGFMRLNFATRHANLKTALDRISAAVKKL